MVWIRAQMPGEPSNELRLPEDQELDPDPQLISPVVNGVDPGPDAGGA